MRPMRNYFYNSFLGVHHLFLLFFVMMYFHPLSNIIKYQENIDIRPPFCDIIDPSELLNSSKIDCNQSPVFTSGKKHVRTLYLFFGDLTIQSYFRVTFGPPLQSQHTCWT